MGREGFSQASGRSPNAELLGLGIANAEGLFRLQASTVQIGMGPSVRPGTHDRRRHWSSASAMVENNQMSD